MKATVIIPTTGDRGPLLPFSVGSVLNQTIEEIEVFIIGDGVSDTTKEVITKLQHHDKRIRFFDYPKGFRRGEIYRHQVLQQARGKFICYLCDRDLWLPDHIELKLSFHNKYNFVSNAYIDIKPDGAILYGHKIKFYGPRTNYNNDKVSRGSVPLSCASHSLELYQKLPYGWRTTPRNEYTDRYMWKQILAHPECNPFSSLEASVLYFHRGHHPGWAAEKRKPELDKWFNFIQNPDNIDQLKRLALQGLLQERADLRDEPFLLKGFSLKEIPKRVLKEFDKYVKRFLKRVG